MRVYYVMPCGVTLSHVFMFILRLCITKMWYISHNLFFLSVLVVFNFVWLCNSVLATLTWQRPRRHALFEVEKYQSRDVYFLFFCASRHAHNFTCLIKSERAFCTWIFVRWCVYLYICVCDPNDAFLLYSIGLSARCWWLSHTPAPLQILLR